MNQLIPGYRIVRALGEGGMAKVWLAIEEKFDREVALKIMSPQLAKQDAQYRERFVREARIIAQLMHPNIVTIFDVGVHDDLHYLAMEYVPGQDLKLQAASLSVKQLLNTVKQIAQALHFAHQKKYVHRDIKPENILIHRDDGRAILTDFGIARLNGSNENLTQTGLAIGTPAYMSPEQALGRATDHRSDLYSLGAVFFYLLTGRAPFEADSAVALGIKHAMDPIPQLSGELSRFQPFINLSLAKRADQRFQSGEAMANAVDQLLQQLPESFEQVWQRARQQNKLVQETDKTLIQDVLDQAHTRSTQNVATKTVITPTNAAHATTQIGPLSPQNNKTTTTVTGNKTVTTNADSANSRGKINVGISRHSERRPAPRAGVQASRQTVMLPDQHDERVPPKRLRYQTLAIIMLVSPFIAVLLSSFDLFTQTGGDSVYFTAAELVRFLGFNAGWFAFWLATRQLAWYWPVKWQQVYWSRVYVLPFSSLLAVYGLSHSCVAMLQPLLGFTLYNWLFILALLFCAVWIELLIAGRGTAYTRRMGP